MVKFRVALFRNIHDSGWIDVGQVTAFIGQNESGKSNLCEALFKLLPFDASSYDINFDWPVDLWEKKSSTEIVCRAIFELNQSEETALLDALQSAENKKATKNQTAPEDAVAPDEKPTAASALPKTKSDKPITIELSRNYAGKLTADYGNLSDGIDREVAWKVVEPFLPKFVYIFDYNISGQQVDLPALAKRIADHGYAKLSAEEQTIKIILDLAKVNIEDFIAKGGTAEGRTLRSFDKRQASAYLTRKFSELWGQKEVEFQIEIDGPTLNIFVQDVGFSMPVRLDRRSTGFRWYVAFAWRFTHATAGEFKNVILLLEEPGIHLHPAGQRDLIQFFDELGQNNQVIYTSHLPNMIDTGTPERVRIIEIRDHHTTVIPNIISRAPQPMMVIEAALGLSPSMSDLLGHRTTLIVEGTDDFVILNKLSGLFSKAGEQGLPETMYLWPSQGASKTPMYAGFLIGHKWKGGVLVDSDEEGREAIAKIKGLYAEAISDFPLLTLGPAIGEIDASIAVEDLLPRDLYLDCVNAAYRIRIVEADLRDVELRPISVAVDEELKARGFTGLQKSRVLGELLKRFDAWRRPDDLPPVSRERVRKLFKKIQSSFGEASISNK